MITPFSRSISSASKLGVAEHVDEHVERRVARLGGAADVVARVLLAGEGVELAADRVDLAGDVARRRPPLGPLEEHVLGEVRDPVRLRRLVARAGREHDEAGDRLRVRHRRGQHPQAVRKRVALEDPHRRPWYRGTRGGREDAEGGRGAARVAGPGADRRAAAGRAHVVAVGLRHVVPRRPDVGRRRRRARVRARAAATPTCSCSSATRAATPLTIEAATAFAGPKWLVTAKAESAARGAVRRGRRRDARGRGELLPHGRATPARSRRSPRCAARTSRWLPDAVAERLAGERLPVSEHERWCRRRGPRLADRAGGGAEAARGRVRGRRGAPARGAPARAPRRDRRERALLRARGRGPRGRARRRDASPRSRRSAAT